MEERVVKTLDEKIANFEARMAPKLAREAEDKKMREAARVLTLQTGYLQRTGRKELRP